MWLSALGSKDFTIFYLLFVGLQKSQTQMTLVLLQIFVWSLLGTFSASYGSWSDITCLKSVRDSLEDLLNKSTSSWTIDDHPEAICEYVGVTCSYYVDYYYVENDYTEKSERKVKERESLYICSVLYYTLYCYLYL